MPPAPLEYTYHVWRRQMGVGYAESMTTPFTVILRDLEMLQLENKWGPQSISPDEMPASGSAGQPQIIRQVVG